ncbi:MAG TPA: hypothetical protein VHA75_16595, partial [Rugosimonospora sp.]|nr:hypothetical protein [Rugosimonospora sp.]
VRLFIGVDTRGSAVHRLFPRWAGAIGTDEVLAGVDIPADAPPGAFARLVHDMRDNPRVHGAVVTSHKLRLYRACREIFDTTEALVDLTGEVNALDTRAGVRAFARDAQSLDILFRRTPADEVMSGRPVICFGAGGSAIALLLATRLDIAATVAAGSAVPVPAPSARALTVVGRRAEAGEEVRGVAERIGGARVDVEIAPDPAACAAVAAGGPADALLVNATGLGKTAEGSPLPGAAAFPAAGAAWDFNYRGPLTFLRQARDAGVPWRDGWDYFLAGWSCALGAALGEEPERILSALSAVSVRPN